MFSLGGRGPFGAFLGPGWHSRKLLTLRVRIPTSPSRHSRQDIFLHLLILSFFFFLATFVLKVCNSYTDGGAAAPGAQARQCCEHANLGASSASSSSSSPSSCLLEAAERSQHVVEAAPSAAAPVLSSCGIPVVPASCGIPVPSVPPPPPPPQREVVYIDRFARVQNAYDRQYRPRGG